MTAPLPREEPGPGDDHHAPFLTDIGLGIYAVARWACGPAVPHFRVCEFWAGHTVWIQADRGRPPAGILTGEPGYLTHLFRRVYPQETS